MHPHTAERETLPFSLWSSPLSSLSFHKASWKTKHATVAGWEHSISTDMHRSKHGNPLLHVLRINIIFIHKHSRKTAVVLLRTHTHTRTGMGEFTIKCHAGRLKHTCPGLLSMMTWSVGGRLIWSCASEQERERERERENNQIKEEEEVTGRISKGRGGRESSSTLTWWI